ncbi:hypothetical protein ACJRO7_019635 [Eucalyptus globulus]
MRYVKPLSLFQDVLMAHTKKKSRLLGLDVKTNIDSMAPDLQSLMSLPFSLLFSCFLVYVQVSEFLLLGFVVGCPLDRFRSPNCDAVQMKVFIDELSKTGKLEGVCYTYWEETFTSKNVELLLQPLTLHPVVAKTIMDKFAAMGILQGYLDYANKKQRSESSE